MADEIEEVEKPVYKRFKLYTGGKEPGIDAIAIMHAVLKDLPVNELHAALQYIADLHGFALSPKRS